jgi:hypothetical protein
LRWSFITSSYFRTFLRISKLRASTFCCAFSSALLIQGWMIASPSLSPSRCSIPSIRSEPKMRIRSSSQRQEEFGGARIALAAGAAAQLIVDAPAFVALGADDEQPAGLPPPSCVGGDLVANGLDRPRARAKRDRSMPLPAPAQPHVQIAAQLDVGAAAGHVGGDGHRARLPGLGDDEGFLLVIAGVQHRVRNSCFFFSSSD